MDFFHLITSKFEILCVTVVILEGLTSNKDKLTPFILE